MHGSSQSWKQTFVFDRFGNRTFNTSSGNTTTLPTSFNADIYNPTIDTSNNRFSAGQGYSYDAAGNVTANAAGQSFEYDAEHHQTKVKVTSSGATVATYQYDGSGKRVKKIVGTEETIFIYDAMGKSVAEYTLNATTSPTVKTRYTTQDHLGSPRVITDGVGQAQERHDYLAYGEEAGSSLSAVRTAGQKYTSGSAVRDRYTGYERDDESGLDFAQARYYSSAHGRFTSVDPLTASATIKNPQTFNRYSYALNSPYKFTDPLGLRAVVGSEVNDPDTNSEVAAEQPGQSQSQTEERIPTTGYYLKIEVGPLRQIERKELVGGTEQTVIGAERQLQLTAYKDGAELRSDSVTISESVQPGKPSVASGKSRAPAPDALVAKVTRGSRDSTGKEFSTNAPEGKVVGDKQSLTIASAKPNDAREGANSLQAADLKVTDRVIFSIKVDGVVVGSRDIQSTKSISKVEISVGGYHALPKP